MSDIAPIGPALNGPVNRTSPNHAAGVREFIETPGGASLGERLEDRVELSERAQRLDLVRQSRTVRQDVVDRLRAAIESGEYPSQEQVQSAAERLIDHLTQ